MLRTLRKLGRFIRFGSLSRGDFTSATERPVENYDAVTAAMSGSQSGQGMHGTVPPNYVKSHDEGRPRH